MKGLFMPNRYFGVANKPRHPKFDAMWAKYERMIFWWSRNLSKRFYYPPETFLGYLTVRFNNALYGYRKRKGKFTTYYSQNIYADAWLKCVSKESELRAKTYTPASKKNFLLKSSSAEIKQMPILFHNLITEIPPSEELDVEVMKCFVSKQDFWRFLCKGMTKRNIEMAFRRFRLEMNLEEIGDEYGLTRERVRQITNNCLKHFRRRMGNPNHWKHIFKIKAKEKLTKQQLDFKEF